MTATPAYHIEKFGREQQPIVVIDDFIADPDAIKQAALTKPFSERGPYYPGIRAPANAGYLSEVMALMTDILKTVFDIQGGAKLIECNYSLVTTPPEDLKPIQRLPHFDGIDPNRIAILHYLSGAEQGGTAFYRHRSTGFETVTEDKLRMFQKALQDDVAREGLPNGYFQGNSPIYEKIGEIEARPNRCLFYRGITLHSGQIPLDFNFSPDPAVGRLTVNTFLSGR